LNKFNNIFPMKTLYCNHLFPVLLIITIILQACGVKNDQENRPNVLLIVADDMNYDSPGFAGGVAPDVTPNLDRLAEESIYFENAFVTVSVCQPSRQSMLSGLLPHNYGSGGFFPMAEGTVTLPLLLGEAGYLTGNIHKKHHHLPVESFNWAYTNEELGLTAPDGVVGRDPEMVADAFRRFIIKADEKKQPFFMVVNSADPHRPFHGDPPQIGIPFWGNEPVEIKEPSRIYDPEEVVVPASLPDIPDIRTDLAKYASSVRRLDDMTGACLDVLDELDKRNSTLVIFVSDNGIPMAFGKFDCYLGSNRTPLLMRWPDRWTEPRKDSEHLVSLMDITPTLLELAGLPVPPSLDGRSLIPLLDGEEPDKPWRETIVMIRNQDIFYGDAIRLIQKRDHDYTIGLRATGWVPNPEHEVDSTYTRQKEIRSFYDGKFGYIYNNCYREDGLQISPIGVIVPYGGGRMRTAAATNESVGERYRHYLLRAQEELYDWTEDPGSLQNLAGDPEYAEVLSKARAGLLQWMKSNQDPLAGVFQDQFGLSNESVSPNE
jgi:N-sulfoglucosamine sulfohydrolase